MGIVINFPNSTQMIEDKNDFLLVKNIVNSQVTVKVHVLPEELHALLRLLLEEEKLVKGYIQSLTYTHESDERNYWKTIHTTFNGLIKKFKQVRHVDEVLEGISFVELDCLVGVLEQRLQQTYLTKLQSLEDEAPLITHLLEQTYEKIYPLYEKELSVTKEQEM